LPKELAWRQFTAVGGLWTVVSSQEFLLSGWKLGRVWKSWRYWAGFCLLDPEKTGRAKTAITSVPSAVQRRQQRLRHIPIAINANAARSRLRWNCLKNDRCHGTSCGLARRNKNLFSVQERVSIAGFA
jgi:hypothetical protein